MCDVKTISLLPLCRVVMLLPESKATRNRRAYCSSGKTLSLILRFSSEINYVSYFGVFNALRHCSAGDSGSNKFFIH
jgi:hypothetical protein